MGRYGILSACWAASAGVDFKEWVVTSIPEDARPVWPSVVGCPLIRWLTHQLQVDDIFGPMPDAGAYAVCAGVSASYHDHMLVLQWHNTWQIIAKGTVWGLTVTVTELAKVRQDWKTLDLGFKGLKGLKG